MKIYYPAITTQETVYIEDKPMKDNPFVVEYHRTTPNRPVLEMGYYKEPIGLVVFFKYIGKLEEFIEEVSFDDCRITYLMAKMDTFDFSRLKRPVLSWYGPNSTKMKYP